jgi:hypothetical protein
MAAKKMPVKAQAAAGKRMPRKKAAAKPLPIF